MTATSTGREAIQHAQDLADELAIIVDVQSRNKAMTWLLDHTVSILELTNVCLALAAMVNPDASYVDPLVKERFDPPPRR